MNQTNEPRDPAEIERDIRRTQDEMSRTVDQIGNQLTARNLLNAVLDKVEENDVDGRMLIDGARRNPLALAMIAGGAIWLVSDSDAKLPSKMPSMGFGKSGSDNSADSGDFDPHHRNYVAHMERVEWRDGEEIAEYQRRRDLARANYLMLERRHDEDDHTFRTRLDDATEKFRQRRQAWSEQGSRATAAGRRNASRAAHKAEQAFTENPLVGGLAAAAVGAIFGSVLPITRTEQENLSGVGEKAREVAGEQKDKLTQKARENKDELVSKMEDKVRPSGQRAGGQTGQSQPGSANDEHNLQLAASQSPTTQPGEPSAGSTSRSTFDRSGGGSDRT